MRLYCPLPYLNLWVIHYIIEGFDQEYKQHLEYEKYKCLSIFKNLFIIILEVIYQIMFGNSYQNGHFFQVWDSRANNDKHEMYKQLVRMIPPSNKNYFDKEVKSQTTKMILPASDQKQLSLHQKFLVLHIFIPHGCQWSMQLSITDINGIKRRVNLTTSQGKMEIKFFSLRYPVDNIQKGTWLFLAINVHSFIDAFKGQVFRSLDHLTIGSTCQIRRIFTMKQWLHWQIPKSFWLSNQINQQFQLIEYRQLSLPKINLNKSANYDQSPAQVQIKSSSIKDSKSSLNKSQIIKKQKTKNIISHSQSPKINQVIQKQKKSLTNNKSNIITNLSKINNRKSQSLKKSEIQVNNILQNKLSQIPAEKFVEKQSLRISPKKSPFIEKSFQEDQALNYKPNQDSENNFQTSHQSFANLNKRESVKKTERWEQDQQVIKRSNKKFQKQNQNLERKIFQKSKQKVLTKQNSKKKIENAEKKVQLQLIYDEMVGCYYHPQTQTYYQLKQ